MKLDRVDSRLKLTLRRDPYWHRLAAGRYLGFRRMTRGRPGVWLARRYSGEKYEYPEDGIGDFSALPEGEQFDAAKRAAEEWFKQRDMGVSAKSATVKAACEAYVEKMREKSEAAANDAAGRFKRLLYDDPIGRVALAKLTPTHFKEWKGRVLAGSSKDKNPKGSFNRNATSLRAALNLARERLEVASDLAWRSELKPFTGAAGRRTLYLDRIGRRSLIEKASKESQPFFMALALIPMRPGEVAKLKVENLDVEQRVIRLPSGKTEARTIPLSSDALAHFKGCARNKLPSAWLISRTDGSQWKKEAWCDEIKAAARKAKLPKAIVAYTVRHSAITDLVKGGLDLFHVAKLSGTSVAMIEKHYGQLQNEHARRALEKLSLAY